MFPISCFRAAGPSERLTENSPPNQYHNFLGKFESQKRRCLLEYIEMLLLILITYRAWTETLIPLHSYIHSTGTCTGLMFPHIEILLILMWPIQIKTKGEDDFGTRWGMRMQKERKAPLRWPFFKLQKKRKEKKAIVFICEECLSYVFTGILHRIRIGSGTEMEQQVKVAKVSKAPVVSASLYISQEVCREVWLMAWTRRWAAYLIIEDMLFKCVKYS